MSLGVYPDISLKEARERHKAARKSVANGIKPTAGTLFRKVAPSITDTFKSVAEEWLDNWKLNKTAGHIETVRARLGNDVYP